MPRRPKLPAQTQKLLDSLIVELGLNPRSAQARELKRELRDVPWDSERFLDLVQGHPAADNFVPPRDWGPTAAPPRPSPRVTGRPGSAAVNKWLMEGGLGRGLGKTSRTLRGLAPRLGTGLGLGLTGLGAAASAYAIYELLDSVSGAERAREAYTPEAWQGRYMQAYDQRERMTAQMDAESTNSLMDRTATQAESLNKVGDIAMKAYRDQAMAPTKRSMDKLEALLGPDLDTVKQVSQQSPPSFADFAAGEGIL